MMKIKRILCPTDLSPEADDALRYALALAKAYEAKLILLYCKQTGSVPSWISGARAPNLFQVALFERLNANDFKNLDWTGFVCSADNIGLAITTEAELHNADLIVMRSRRRPHAAVLMGSTAETVYRHAPCPVLITHPNETEWVGLLTNEIDLRRVLVAYDFSSDSELAFEYGCSFGREYQAEVHLLHVLDKTQTDSSTSVKAAREAHNAITRKLDKAIPEEARRSCAIKSVVRSGRTYKQVLSYARHHEIDLICMGATGGGWNWGKLFGSNVDRVLRQAPCPVFVARPITYGDAIATEAVGAVNLN